MLNLQRPWQYQRNVISDYSAETLFLPDSVKYTRSQPPMTETRPLLEVKRKSRLQHLLAREETRSKYRLFALAMLLSLAVIGFTLLMFCAMPLANVAVTEVRSIVGLPDLYEFELVMTGSNSNIVPCTLTSADLDIFASSYIESYVAGGIADGNYH
jgi:Vacuolar segregation subunit 7